MLAWEDESGTTRLSWNDVAYPAMTGALMRADPSDGEPLRPSGFPRKRLTIGCCPETSPFGTWAH